MDTTPVHPRLWHRDFWLLAMADMFLTMSMYMFLPLLAQWICVGKGQNVSSMMGVMGSYAVGLFIFGPFCNYFVQRHRRNKVYMVAAMGVVVSLLLIGFDVYGLFGKQLPMEAVVAARFMQGASFALAQMVLLSTLAVDVAESAQRTDANHALSWFSRLAMVLGPLAAYELLRYLPVGIVFFVMAAMAFMALLMVALAKIPFKAPDDEFSIVDTDRFFLGKGKWLFFNNLLFAAVVGMLLYTYADAYCYGMMLVGFYIAIRILPILLAAPQNSWQTVIVILTALVAVAAMSFIEVMPLFLLSFLCWGVLIGLVSSQMSVMYIHVSRHCQRGTSQSTNFLSWEFGVALGVMLAMFLDSYGECFMIHAYVWVTTAILTALFFLIYIFFTLPWCLRHHQREKV